ncbi:MAG: cation transporter [Xanthomonadales bacterium]|nr:cation transporter [Xanthomonadales bacterium]MBP6078793.1 cation transporter [Xanthomonadales bacterium]MBP7623002.1 cation transporter [Xanthomonadales bacterium]
MAGKGDSTRAILYALGANFAIFATKLFAAVLTTSGAMMAEAVHSLADCGNQALLLWGLKRSKRPPTPDFPLGFGKAIYFWSFLVALMLFSVGGMFSLYEGLHKLQHPEPLRLPWLAVGVLAFGIVAESFSMWGCLREVNKSRGDQSLWRWFRDSRQSELIVIFGEDLAALFGLSFALVAILLTMATGNPAYDAYGTLGIGVLLIVVAVFISVEVKALLIGQSADPALDHQLRTLIEQQPEVKRVFNLITLQLGNDVMLAAKIELATNGSMEDACAAINRVEVEVRRQHPEIRFSFVEPDTLD